jgi:hypothetical protein
MKGTKINMTDFSAVLLEIYTLLLFDSLSKTHGEIY